VELHELPDLSDWRLIEVWSIEEAAMLWAGIDPMEHVDVRLSDLKHAVSLLQYRKAFTFQRAIAEAVCGGTLPFVEAWEEHNDYNNGPWGKKIEFPDLPEHSLIVHHLTRVSQAAFMKWAQSKKMWSLKQSLQRVQSVDTGQECNSDNTIEMERTTKPLALAPPAYLDRTHPLSPAELLAANEAWLAITQNGDPKDSGTAVRAAMMKYLNEHPDHRSLGAAAKERICTVANWNKKGGATKTPERGK